MRNPWLDIPADDYEGHMSSPAVDQLCVLSRVFREALTAFRPADVLLLGCATGNGLRAVDPAITRRVTGVDINAEYLERLRLQFPQPSFDLELQCADATAISYAPRTFDLVHCALILEYLDWRQLLSALSPAIRPGGGMCVVLQSPSNVSPVVTPTKYLSLLQLEPLFHFVEPSALVDHARHAGLSLWARRTEPLRSGKAFELMMFRAPL